MWQQHELWDGTYTLEDLLNAHEMMAVKAENERRQYESLEMHRSAPTASAPRLNGRR